MCDGAFGLSALGTQATQRPLGERREQQYPSDRGVIAFRRVLLRAIEAAQRGERPKGVLAPEDAEALVRIESFVGARARGVVTVAAARLKPRLVLRRPRWDRPPIPEVRLLRRGSVAAYGRRFCRG